MQIYLDNAATTRVCDEAAEAAIEIMKQCFGNPSSTHALGRAAKHRLDSARQSIALALGAKAQEIVFTSGGTEGNNLALISAVKAKRREGGHIISSAAEHDSVRKTLDYLEAQGIEVTRLSPNEGGSIDVSAVNEALREDTVLVSIMQVNNETGAVTDIASISKMMNESGSSALLHTDAVQAFLKVPVNITALGVDLLTISGHKIHAPKGVGALFVRTGIKLTPRSYGGAQESGVRAGTEALPSICAFAAAAELGLSGLEASSEKMQRLRSSAAERLVRENPKLRIIGGGAPHILSISLPGYKSEVLMNYLEAREIYVSKSSACKRGGRSHVLEAMRLPHAVIDGALRISLSAYTTAEELDTLCLAIYQARKELFTVLR